MNLDRIVDKILEESNQDYYKAFKDGDKNSFTWYFEEVKRVTKGIVSDERITDMLAVRRDAKAVGPDEL